MDDHQFWLNLPMDDHHFGYIFLTLAHQWMTLTLTASHKKKPLRRYWSLLLFDFDPSMLVTCAIVG
jgi:hypothetical protein